MRYKIAVVSGLATALIACFSAGASGEEPITYRRIFVPAENVEAWPTEGRKFLPVESRDFERWVKAANESANGVDQRAAITSAEYFAKVEGDRLVDGHGRWTVELRGEGPAFLPLSAMSIEVRDARWRNAPQAPVRLGIWGMSGELAARQGLEVSRSGMLEFNWTARSEPTHNGTATTWQLPRARSARLILELPENQQPRIDGGIVVESERLPIEASDYSVRRRRWVLQFESVEDAVLRIEDPRATQKANIAGLTIRDNVQYQVTQRGVEIQTTLELNGTDVLPAELAVPLPEGVELTSIEVGEREQTWNVDRDAEDGTRRVLIKLPESDRRTPLRITLRAWQPLVDRQLWRLPKLRPDGVAWESGEIKLIVADNLELRELKPTGCIEVGAEAVAGGQSRAEEAWRFAAYAPTAALDVSVANRPATATLRLGSSLAMGDPDILGRLVTEWNVAGGSMHTLTGQLTDDWLVESVEAIPEDALGEWFVDERDGRRSIEVQLSKSITRSSKVSVVINCRLPRRSFNETLSAETMRVIRWRGAGVVEHDLTFQTTERFAVEPFGGLQQIAVDDLGDDRRTLLGSDLLENAVFDLTGTGREAGLRFAERRGQFTAEIDVDLTLGIGEHRQVFTLAIGPTSNQIDRLIVYATEPLADDVRWTESTGAPIVAERIAADDPRRTRLPIAGEAWVVKLAKPTSRPFEIALITQASDTTATRLPLVVLPEAIQQTGRVLVRGDMEAAAFEERQMHPAVPPPLPEDATRAPIRAAYRFDPAKCLSGSAKPQLQILTSRGRGVSSIVVQRATIESFYMRDGAASHDVTYELRNDSNAPFEVCLPETAELQAVTVDGKAASFVQANDYKCIEIRLPSNSTAAAARISFTTNGAPLSLNSKLEPPLMPGRTPVLAGQWTIRLPEGYTVAETGGLNWRQRLFGPLGRVDGRTPFHPFRPADWMRLMNSITGLGIGDSTTADSLVGWNEYRRSFVADVPAAVIVAEPPLISSWSVSMFLICFIAGSLMRRRRAVFLVLVCIAAGLAIGLPSVVAPLATGALLGLVLSLFLRRARQDYAYEGRRSRMHALSTVGVVTAVLAAGVASSSLGQSANSSLETQQVASGDPIQRVLIPVDEKGRPMGSKYFVGEEFLRELLQYEQPSPSQAGEWLLKDLRVSGELRQAAEPANVVAGEWSLACDVELLSRDTVTVLPLNRREAEWPTSALVDGVPVPMEWSETSDGCAIKIAEPGEHTIVIAFTPAVATNAEGHSLNLTLPKKRGAVLKLVRPTKLDDLAVAGAVVARAIGEGSASEYVLDGESRLSLRWPMSESTEAAARRLQVAELEWLRVSDYQLELDTKYVFEGDGELPKSVTIGHSRDWQPLTEQSAIEKMLPSGSDGGGLVRVSLADDRESRRQVTLRWRHINGQRLGQFEVPPIELVSQPVTQRWRAVSATPTLACVATVAEAQQASATEFLAVWDEPGVEEPPRIAVKTSERSDVWSVDVSPLSIASDVDQELHVAVGSNATRIVYYADVRPGTRNRYQFPLRVPPNLTVDDVSIDQAGRQIPVRWVRAADDRVNIFFSEELAGQFGLRLRATRPRNADGWDEVPLVSAEKELATAAVHLYRDEDVILDTEGLPEEETIGQVFGTISTGWSARRLGVYRVDQQAAKNVRFRARPNDVKLAGDTLTSLSKRGEKWIAGFHSNLIVEQGSLETLRLPSFRAWQGPFTIETSAGASVEGPANGDPHVVVRFSDSLPTGSQLQLSLQAPLEPMEGPVAVPQIDSLPRIRGKQFVSVPSSVAGRAISWSAFGLKEAPLPKSLVARESGQGARRSFEIVDRTYELSIAPATSAQHAARVAVADTKASYDESGRQLIATRFVVEPEGLDACELVLPEHQELVEVRLDSRPAILRLVGESKWRVSSGPPQLPFVLDVTARLADSGDEVERAIQRPVLEIAGAAIPVDLGLWSYAPAAGGSQPSISATAGVTAAEQAALRFELLLSIAEAGTTAALELMPPDGDIWLRSWAERLIEARDEARSFSEALADRKTASQILLPEDDRLTQTSIRLDEWLEQVGDAFPRGESNDRSIPRPEPKALADVSSNVQPPEWRHLVTAGEFDRLTLDAGTAAAAAWQSQLLGLAIVAGMCGVSLALVRLPEARDFVYRWPHAIAFVAGLAYWAWLRPSWLGLVIAACGVLLAWRSGWPGRPFRMEGSTVLRPTRP